MVRPGRELLSGRVEADEAYLGGLEAGLSGEASAKCLHAFVQESLVAGNIVQTDGKGRKESPSERLPRVHRFLTLLKRWLMGAPQSPKLSQPQQTFLSPRAASIGRRTRNLRCHCAEDAEPEHQGAVLSGSQEGNGIEDATVRAFAHSQCGQFVPDA